MTKLRRPFLVTLTSVFGGALLLVLGIHFTANTRLDDIAGNWKIVSTWDVSGTLRNFRMNPQTSFTIGQDGYTRFEMQGMEGVMGRGFCLEPCFVWSVNYLNQRFEVWFLGDGTDRIVMVEPKAGSVIIAYRDSSAKAD
jgi:hypothetical protein